MKEEYNTNLSNQQDKRNDRLEFEIKRALLDDTPAPNVDQAYKAFLRRNHLVPKKKFLWTSIIPITIAACIALLLYFQPWQANKEDNANIQTHKQLAQMGNVVYEATDYHPYITLRMGKEIIDLGNKKNAQKAGIAIMPDHEIRVFNPHKESDEPITLSVPAGQTAKLLLNDGTRVKLNAGSSITFPRHFRDFGTREVELYGEAYFEVSHDERHPFIVKTEDINTKVLGTTFNVRHFKDENTKVTLIEGCVKVESKSEQVYLQPLQAAILDSQGKLKTTTADAEEALSWLHREFYFDGQNLKEIMTEIGRWYNLNVVFSNSHHLEDQLHFSADRATPISEIVRQLQLIGNVHIELNHKKQVLLVK